VSAATSGTRKNAQACAPHSAEKIISPQMLSWFTEQFQIALREMFAKGEQGHAFDFSGRNPVTGAMELYSVVISIMRKADLDALKERVKRYHDGCSEG